MLKSVQRAMVKWQLEKLQSLLAGARAHLRQSTVRQSDLSYEHVRLAEERLADAMGALKYGKFDQASLACRQALLHAGLAEFVSRYSHVVAAGMDAVSTVKDRGVDAGQQTVLYLASSLAAMKAAIEYTNCTVSQRAQEILDGAMDLYNDALTNWKQGESSQAVRCAQAGLMRLSLASRVLKMDNELLSLPGWRDLSNPMLASPLREVDEFIKLLARVRSELILAGEDGCPDARAQYEKALRDFDGCVRALSADRISRAQGRLMSGMRRLDRALLALTQGTNAEPAPRRAAAGWEPVVDFDRQVRQIETLLEKLGLKREDYVVARIRSLEGIYKLALREFARGDFAEAEKQAGQARLELDLIRRAVLPEHKDNTGGDAPGEPDD